MSRLAFLAQIPDTKNALRERCSEGVTKKAQSLAAVLRFRFYIKSHLPAKSPALIVAPVAKDYGRSVPGRTKSVIQHLRPRPSVVWPLRELIRKEHA